MVRQYKKIAILKINKNLEITNGILEDTIQLNCNFNPSRVILRFKYKQNYRFTLDSAEDYVWIPIYITDNGKTDNTSCICVLKNKNATINIKEKHPSIYKYPIILEEILAIE